MMYMTLSSLLNTSLKHIASSERSMAGGCPFFFPSLNLCLLHSFSLTLPPSSYKYSLISFALVTNNIKISQQRIQFVVQIHRGFYATQ